LGSNHPDLNGEFDPGPAVVAQIIGAEPRNQSWASGRPTIDAYFPISEASIW
jgi:hypothetical protein